MVPVQEDDLHSGERMKKPRWYVKYEPWGARRAVTRWFPTERRARAFYKRLWTRPYPPTGQTVVRESVPAGLEDMRIVRVAVVKRAARALMDVRFGRLSFRIECGVGAFSDFPAFRKALLEQTGVELPNRRVARWSALVRCAMNRKARP